MLQTKEGVRYSVRYIRAAQQPATPKLSDPDGARSAAYRGVPEGVIVVLEDGSYGWSFANPNYDNFVKDEGIKRALGRALKRKAENLPALEALPESKQATAHTHLPFVPYRHQERLLELVARQVTNTRNAVEKAQATSA